LIVQAHRLARPGLGRARFFELYMTDPLFGKTGRKKKAFFDE
jgi:hypothetical protein